MQVQSLRVSYWYFALSVWRVAELLFSWAVTLTDCFFQLECFCDAFYHVSGSSVNFMVWCQGDCVRFCELIWSGGGMTWYFNLDIKKKKYFDKLPRRTGYKVCSYLCIGYLQLSILALLSHGFYFLMIIPLIILW